MTPAREIVAAARRELETAYGLALEGLSEDQIASAVAQVSGAAPRDPADPRWLERVVDRLPIDESWLFRDEDLWRWLRDEAGPALLERSFAAGRPVRVLSLGCSAGQEPFSAALVFQGLLEAMGIPPSAACHSVQIVGVDSSPARIEAARAGVLNAWSVQRAGPDWLRGRVALEDAQSGRHRVDGSVRAMCRFEVGNLVALAAAGNAALGGWDLVLCRNVLIYFRAAEAERIAAGIGRGLDPGALLALSAAEAHLLQVSGRMDPAGPLGTGRARGAAGAGPFPGVEAPRPARPGPSHPSRTPVPTPVPAPRPSRRDAVAGHLRAALEHAAAGRTADALRAARAALFHDPRLLFSRLLVGRHLIAVDAERGREVLRGLVAAAARLPPEDEVPCSDGLSVAQVAAAARLLLREPEGR
jgi:chemotaxis methyl-accepting protein methylase